MYQEITHKELESLVLNKEDIELIDVREQNEYDMIRIPEAKLIPVSIFTDHINDIDWGKPVYIFCRTGGRSGQVCAWLESHGKSATNVSGSIKALWGDQSKILEIQPIFNPLYLK